MGRLRSIAPASLVAAVVLAALLSTGGASARPAAVPRGPAGAVEVVVTLPRPPLAVQIRRDRTLAAAVRRPHALDVRTPAAVSYLGTLAAAQRTFQRRLALALPAARIRWRYGVALDGVSVVLPRSELPRLRALPGATVWPNVTYRALDGAPAGAGAAAAAQAPAQLIGAPNLWGSSLATAGQGVRIAILDDGVDQAHPYFNPSGFAYPPGFPKGNTAYTTPKVIVARAFPSPSTSWRYAARPFDPTYSDHATHVAGIAAGDYDTLANGPNGPLRISGIAPRAYIGNYKVLTVPTSGWGLDGNAPEIAKAIDQAVADGMNVINLSLGEVGIAPSRDVVITAIENAAAAGVVPVIAAGNEGDTSGHGSIDSPATAPDAIAVAASSPGGNGSPPDQIAYFSSRGPTPVSLLLKPDVTAPGEDILSAVPPTSWDSWDGTSMASPHVAGATALLLQRHPQWTVEQVKSALESTGDPVYEKAAGVELPPTTEGGGRIDLARADSPLVFTDPASLSWGLVRRGFSGAQALSVTDAGGGTSPWNVLVDMQSAPAGVTVAPSAATVVPGTSVGLTLTVARNATEGDATGFVLLERSGDVRRVPFWLRVEVPRLGLDPHSTLTHPGVYSGDTAGKASRVSSYRYPDGPVASGVPTDLSGPEQVFRFTVGPNVANAGVVVLSHASGVTVSPRLVQDGDENRLVGTTGVPATMNPYAPGFVEPQPYPVVAAVLPPPGSYDVVFDTPAAGRPGRFTFRFWVNDTTPPSVTLLRSSLRAGTPIRLSVRDTGSGVDPGSLRATLDGKRARLSYGRGVVSLPTTALAPGRHTLVLTTSDYQETKNMEDVGPVLPNTRVFRATVTVRP